MAFQADLEKSLGLETVTYKYNLAKGELFHEAIKNGSARGRGPARARRAY